MMASRTAQRGRQCMRRQVADDHDAQAAEGQQRARQAAALRGVGVDSVVYRRSGGWSGATGSSMNSSAGQRHAQALAADVQLVHRPRWPRPGPAACGATMGADVVQHHVLGLQRLELLLHRFGRFADDEQFPLRVADLARPTWRSAVGSVVVGPHQLRGHAVCWRVASQASSSSTRARGAPRLPQVDISWIGLTMERCGGAVDRDAARADACRPRGTADDSRQCHARPAAPAKTPAVPAASS